MPDTLGKATVSARAAMARTLFFFAVMFVAFVFIQPDLNPIYR
jgi:hypothetical protein